MVRRLAAVLVKVAFWRRFTAMPCERDCSFKTNLRVAFPPVGIPARLRLQRLSAEENRGDVSEYCRW